MKANGQGDTPFITGNAILAFCLYLSGIPFVDENRPLINLYDNDILKRLGFAGMTLEEGARQALREGKKGDMQWAFVHTQELHDLLEYFKDEEANIKSGDGTVTEEARAIMANCTDNEALMRLGCLILKSRGEFFNLWKGREDLALIRVPNKGKPTIRDGTARNSKGEIVPAKIESRPGFRVVSLSAGNELKKEMKL